MKSFNIKSISTIVTAISIITTGCLKDKNFDNGSIQSVTGPETKVVEIKLTATNKNNFFIFAADNSNSDSTYDLVPINLATADAAPEDLHITVDLDSTLVSNYNTNKGTVYAIPPTNFFTIVNPVVTIPKGSHTAYLQIKFKPSDFLGGDWALGFKITSVQESGYAVSGNLGTGVTVITVKNQYDGTYSSTGYVYHPSAPRAFSEVKVLKTISANSVSCDFGDLGSSGYVALLTVDPLTNKVSISDYSTGIPIVGFDNGLPTTNPGYTPQWSGSSKCNNTYDPATKIFYLRMGYLGSTGWRISEEIVVRQ